MRIIKNFALNSNYSINSIAISSDSEYLALADSNKSIKVYAYKALEVILKRSIEEGENVTDISQGRFKVSQLENEIQSIVLDYHNDAVNSITFARINKYFLVSGGADKTIIIWRILGETQGSEKVRISKTQADITDIQISKNDEFTFCSCIDNNIYIYKSDFQQKQFDLLTSVTVHNNIVTSLCLDPLSENGNIRMASYSDEGRLIISALDITNQGIRANILRDFNELVNTKNKINSIRKKIDWSYDGRFIISVNHHYIKKHKVVHARLINLKDLDKTQVLIGHETAVLIAKFSPVNYVDSKFNSNEFSLLATADKNGNLIIWKIEDEKFSILTEISNFSESNITFLMWVPSGDILFVSNSNGSVYAIEFNDFSIKNNRALTPQTNNVMNNFKSTYLPMNNRMIIDSNFLTTNKQKRITPTLITSQDCNKMDIDSINIQPNKFIQECIRCQKQKIDQLETKISKVKIHLFNSIPEKFAHFMWENKVYDNCSFVQLLIDNNDIAFVNKFENKLIRIFCCNNFFFAVYDTQNLLSIFTLFNTLIFNNLYIEDVTFLEAYKNYLLVITGENKIMILDVFKKKKILDNFLNFNVTSSPSTKISSIKFLDIDRIVIYTDSFNVFKNANLKNILLYNKNLNELIQLDSSINTEIDNMVQAATQEQKSIQSPYCLLLNDPLFYHLLSKIICHREVNENMFSKCYKNNSSIRCVEEQLHINHTLNQQNEFVFYLERFLIEITQKKTYHRIIDFFIYYFKLNEKSFFSIMEDKSDIILNNLINQVIFSSQDIPSEVKEMITRLISF